MFLPILLAATLAPPGPQPPAPSATTFALSHEPVDCVVADRNPRFEALPPRGVDVATARVFFKGASQEWYSVAMRLEGTSFVGVLPSPKKTLKEFHYYIEATSTSLETSRTADRRARVVASPGECRGIVAASAASAASILVQGPAGAVGVPAGFAPAGMVAAGGGISGTTLAVVGGAVGAGAIAATQLKGDDDTSEYAGSVSGQLTLVFGPCTRLERYTFTLWIELTGASSGIAGSDPGTSLVVSATNCATGPQTGLTMPFGISQTPITRSGSALSFAHRETSGQSETQLDFTGSLQGDVITGTATLVLRAPNATGITVSTPMVAAVTLTRR